MTTGGDFLEAHKEKFCTWMYLYCDRRMRRSSALASGRKEMLKEEILLTQKNALITWIPGSATQPRNDDA